MQGRAGRLGAVRRVQLRLTASGPLGGGPHSGETGRGRVLALAACAGDVEQAAGRLGRSGAPPSRRIKPLGLSSTRRISLALAGVVRCDHSDHFQDTKGMRPAHIL